MSTENGHEQLNLQKSSEIREGAKPLQLHAIPCKKEIPDTDDDQPLDFSTKRESSSSDRESSRRSSTSSPKLKPLKNEFPAHKEMWLPPNSSPGSLTHPAYSQSFRVPIYPVKEGSVFKESGVVVPKSENYYPHVPITLSGTYIPAPHIPQLSVDTSPANAINSIPAINSRPASVSPPDASPLLGVPNHLPYGLLHTVPSPHVKLRNRLHGSNMDSSLSTPADKKLSLRMSRPFKSYRKDSISPLSVIAGPMLPYGGETPAMLASNYKYAQYYDQIMNSRRLMNSQFRVSPSSGDSRVPSQNSPSDASQDSSPAELSNGSSGQTTVTSTNSTPTNSTKKRTKSLPDSLKDDVYWERRRKNNEAAKRSRDARRQKEDEIAIRCTYLETENMHLRFENSQLKDQLYNLTNQLNR